MKNELQERLYEKYPKIFADKDKPMAVTAMCWGFECEDGWYWLIDNLCSCIQRYIDANDKPQVIAVQVKEKYGELRFYYYGGNETIAGMVWLAEDLSDSICEVCGSTNASLKSTNGKSNGWLGTRCDDCNSDKFFPIKIRKE